MASVECLEDGSSTGRPPGGVIGRVARPHTLLGTGLTPNTWMTAQTFLSTARAASPPAIFEGESIQPLSEIDLVRVCEVKGAIVPARPIGRANAVGQMGQMG